MILLGDCSLGLEEAVLRSRGSNKDYATLSHLFLVFEWGGEMLGK